MSIVFLNSSSVHLALCVLQFLTLCLVAEVFKELPKVPSAHHSEEDNKIKIKYIPPASNFNLHMHGGDDSNP